MATLTLDTYEFIESLTEAGIPEEQAKAIADGFKKVNLEGVASKQDTVGLEKQILNLEVKLLRWTIAMLVGQVAVFAAIVKWL